MDGRECDFVIHLFICYNLQGSFPRMAEFFVNISLEMLGVRGGFFFTLVWEILKGWKFDIWGIEYGSQRIFVYLIPQVDPQSFWQWLSVSIFWVNLMAQVNLRPQANLTTQANLNSPIDLIPQVNIFSPGNSKTFLWTSSVWIKFRLFNIISCNLHSIYLYRLFLECLSDMLQNITWEYLSPVPSAWYRRVMNMRVGYRCVLYIVIMKTRESPSQDLNTQVWKESWTSLDFL